MTNVLGAWVLAKRMRLLGEVRGLITVPDAIGARYRSRRAQGLAAVGDADRGRRLHGDELLAMGLVIDAIFGTGLGWGIWIGTAVTLAYSVAGGILAGIYNDVFQGTLMALASALVFAFVLRSGGGMAGISHTIMRADPTFLGPWGKHRRRSPRSRSSSSSAMGSLGQPQGVHKFYMLRDPRQLKWYPLLKTVGRSLVLAPLLRRRHRGEGARRERARWRHWPRRTQATPSSSCGFTPALLAALVFSGVAAATMGAVNSFINIGAAA